MENHGNAVDILDNSLTEDYETSGRMVHSIKSIAGTLGAIKVQEISSELELALRNQDKEKAILLYKDFRKYFLEVVNTIKSLKLS